MVNGNLIPDIAGGISRGLQSVQQATIAAGQFGQRQQQFGLQQQQFEQQQQSQLAQQQARQQQLELQQQKLTDKQLQDDLDIVFKFESTGNIEAANKAFESLNLGQRTGLGDIIFSKKVGNRTFKRIGNRLFTVDLDDPNPQLEEVPFKPGTVPPSDPTDEESNALNDLINIESKIMKLKALPSETDIKNLSPDILKLIAITRPDVLTKGKQDAGKLLKLLEVQRDEAFNNLGRFKGLIEASESIKEQDIISVEDIDSVFREISAGRTVPPVESKGILDISTAELILSRLTDDPSVATPEEKALARQIALSLGFEVK